MSAVYSLAPRARPKSKEPSATGIFVVEEEGGVAAIFSGQVEAEIMAGIVAEADTEQRRALDVFVVSDEVGRNQFVVDTANMRIGGADEALDVPRSGAADARLGLRQAEICGIGGCRLA